MPNLPVGLVVDRSMDRIRDDGLRNGCAITRDAGSTNWYASDFTCGINQDPMNFVANFGPYSTKAEARMQMESEELDYLDASGTNGISTWLVLPT